MNLQDELDQEKLEIIRRMSSTMRGWDELVYVELGELDQKELR